MFHAQLEISSELIPEAQIRVRGPERVIRQLQANEIHAEIELADVKPGERTFELTSQQVRHPRDVTVVQVVPSQLHLAFDTRLTREVEIHPRVTGNFADGEQIVKVDADPPRITITGPRHHVEKIDAATTDPIDATGTRGSARLQHECVCVRSAGASRAGDFDSRDRAGAESGKLPLPHLKQPTATRIARLSCVLSLSSLLSSLFSSA